MSAPRPSFGARATRPGVARVGAAAGLIALLGGIAVIVLGSGALDSGETVVAPVTATTPKPKPKPKPVAPAPVSIDVTGVGAYDPDGDQSENDSEAALATDGNAATAWKSERYRSTFRKTGVGLVLDAGRTVRPSRVVVTSETPGYAAVIRVGATADGPFTTLSGSKTISNRTAFALKPGRGRFVVVWITSMPTEGAAAVNEVTVTATS